MGKGHPEAIQKLWPTGTTARADIEGLFALRSQVPETLEQLKAQRELKAAVLHSVSVEARQILTRVVELQKKAKKVEQVR